MSGTPEVSGIVGWVVDLMDALGAPGVGLAIALENVFPPLPSEVFLPLAGFAAARGEMNVIAAIAWTTAGSLVGALVLYGLGAALGRARLRAIVDRMPLVKLSDVDKAEEWFARHGNKAVFFGRMVPLVRSAISVPAGVERMPVLLFAALTAAGSLLWNTAFVLAGYALGENWPVVEQYMGIVSRVVLGLLAAGIIWFVANRLWRHRHPKEPSPDAPTEALPTARPSVDGERPTVRLPVARPVPPPRHPGPPPPARRPAPPQATPPAPPPPRHPGPAPARRPGQVPPPRDQRR